MRENENERRKERASEGDKNAFEFALAAEETKFYFVYECHWTCAYVMSVQFDHKTTFYSLAHRL